MRDAFLDRVRIKSVGRRPLGEQVYEALKAGIINEDLPANIKLTETGVARKMGVSPTPVREAFRRLAAEGFVTISPWQGVRVQSFSDLEVVETYQCREVLEGLACRLAAINIDTAGIQELRRLLSASQKVRLASNLVELNTAFHGLIYAYARNGKLKGLLGIFQDMILRDRVLTAYSASRCREIYSEHTKLVAALEARDAEAAEAAGRYHVQQAFAYRLRQGSRHRGGDQPRSAQLGMTARKEAPS